MAKRTVKTKRRPTAAISARSKQQKLARENSTRAINANKWLVLTFNIEDDRILGNMDACNFPTGDYQTVLDDVAGMLAGDLDRLKVSGRLKVPQLAKKNPAARRKTNSRR